jgi:hypothetical protein
VSFGGRIKRGPMAADVFEQQFTQIYNGLFRDTRLSFKAKGIFGLISTHRDGFGISLESIAACSTDGIAGVRTGLQELIACNYLQRDRARDEFGRLGESVYFITDMPDGLVILMNPGWDVPEVETGRSEPKCDSPTLAEPTLDDRSDKKTTSKHTRLKKSLSPRLPQQRAENTSVNDERETPASPINDQALQVAAAWQAARGGRRNPAAERDITNSAAELLAADWPLPDVIALAQDMAAKYPTGRNLGRHADHWQPPWPTAPKPALRAVQPLCSCCGRQAPTAATQGRHTYCAACTSPCTGCATTVPTDQLHDGQCLTCLPIAERNAA